MADIREAGQKHPSVEYWHKEVGGRRPGVLQPTCGSEDRRRREGQPRAGFRAQAEGRVSCTGGRQLSSPKYRNPQSEVRWGSRGNMRSETFRQLSRLTDTLRIMGPRLLTMGEGSSNTERKRD